MPNGDFAHIPQESLCVNCRADPRITEQRLRGQEGDTARFRSSMRATQGKGASLPGIRTEGAARLLRQAPAAVQPDAACPGA